jgi:hypothetical protein
VAAMVPKLIDIYFDVLISYADENILSEVLKILFQRLDQVCAPKRGTSTTHWPR